MAWWNRKERETLDKDLEAVEALGKGVKVSVPSEQIGVSHKSQEAEIHIASWARTLPPGCTQTAPATTQTVAAA